MWYLLHFTSGSCLVISVYFDTHSRFSIYYSKSFSVHSLMTLDPCWLCTKSGFFRVNFHPTNFSLYSVHHHLCFTSQNFHFIVFSRSIWISDIVLMYELRCWYDQLEGLLEASKTCPTLQDILEVDVGNDTVKTSGSYSRNLRRVRQGLDLVRAIFEQLLSTE